jgi:hypothetical protein
MNALQYILMDKAGVAKPVQFPASPLRPKRRCKSRGGSGLHEASTVLAVSLNPGPALPRMKRSGKPHQFWSSPTIEAKPARPKFSISPMVQEFIERFGDTSLAAANFRYSY